MNVPPVIIYETENFVTLSKKLLGEKECLGLFQHLRNHPKSGDIIPGSGGIRKLRWKRPGIGKRGGVRIIYYNRWPGNCFVAYNLCKHRQGRSYEKGTERL